MSNPTTRRPAKRLSAFFLLVPVLMSQVFCSLNSTCARDLEFEHNGTFATAQVLAVGTDGVDGELTLDFEPLDPAALVARGGLLEDTVFSHSFTDNTPGESFVAYIDNQVFSDSPDTVLRSLDQNFVQLEIDDDSSPLGNGLGSMVVGAVNPDGTIHLEVSGFADFDFDGFEDGSDPPIPHSEVGGYSLYLQFGIEAPIGDIDFYTITDLQPGATWQAETVSGDLDTILASFDTNGNLVETNDDGGAGVLSLLTGTVPRQGTVHLAVTGYSDFGVDGSHSQAGEYSLDFSIVVPEPSAILLCSLLVGLISTGRPRR